MKQCKQCNVNFEITDADRAFYNKIQVPEPTFCTECRAMRRLTWRNERVLYMHKCDMCSKATVSLYSQDKPFTVYCHECWWSDNYNPLKYGRDYDPAKPFFEQLKELQKVVPRIVLFNSEQVNSEYLNHAKNNKNCYLVFACFGSENAFYTRKSIASTDVCDCIVALNKSELCYEGIQIETCYNCIFCKYCSKCTDSQFLLDCRNCQKCFGCVGMRNKKYCWFNEQLTEEEYNKRIAQINTGSFESLEKYKKQAAEHFKKFPRPWSNFVNCLDSTGDALTSCALSSNCYDLWESKDCKNFETGEFLQECMDGYGAGMKNVVTELLYEVHGVIGGRNQFCNASYGGSMKQYCDLCQNSDESFGSIGLKANKYCILNKQYSKEEYFALREKIINKMKADGEYGEFFPATLSPFCYNETTANEQYPITKENAVAQGLSWQDSMPGTFGKQTLQMNAVPDDIKDIEIEKFTNQILECVECKKNYKLIKAELIFYKKMGLPIPRLCPDSRHEKRFALINPRKLWHRQCMCELAGHDNHHDGRQCNVEFETTYAPERQEKIYCQECYQKELI